MKNITLHTFETFVPKQVEERNAKQQEILTKKTKLIEELFMRTEFKDALELTLSSDSLDEAIGSLQNHIGQMAGDYAEIFFSDKETFGDDPYSAWKKFTRQQRLTTSIDYLTAEIEESEEYQNIDVIGTIKKAVDHFKI